MMPVKYLDNVNYYRFTNGFVLFDILLLLLIMISRRLFCFCNLIFFAPWVKKFCILFFNQGDIFLDDGFIGFLVGLLCYIALLSYSLRRVLFFRKRPPQGDFWMGYDVMVNKYQGGDSPLLFFPCYVVWSVSSLSRRRSSVSSLLNEWVASYLPYQSGVHYINGEYPHLLGYISTVFV